MTPVCETLTSQGDFLFLPLGWGCVFINFPSHVEKRPRNGPWHDMAVVRGNRLLTSCTVYGIADDPCCLSTETVRGGMLVCSRGEDT